MSRLPYEVLYNQDCTNLFGITKEPIEPAHVDRMVDEVADGGADLMLVNPNAQRVDYPSRVWQTCWDGYTPGDRSFLGTPEDSNPEGRLHVLTQMMRLAEQCDYLERALGRCRHRGIAPGVTVRMNDMHDAPWPDSHHFSRFYREHPEFHLGGIPARGWGGTGLDYEHAEVRQHYLDLISELANDYDVEALELDFLRFPNYFDRHDISGHCRTMTAFIGRVRDVLNETGRDVALIPRVASTPAAARELGFDVESWAEAGLIDGITVGMFLNTGWEMPVHKFKKAVGPEVSVYACTDSAAWRLDGLPVERISTSRELLRGFAAGYLALGAEGVALFNFFCAREGDHPVDPDFAALAEMRDLASLRVASRRHLLTAGLSQPETDLPVQVPTDLRPGESRRFDMVLAAEAPGAGAEMRVILDGSAGPDDLWLRLNDQPIGKPDETVGGPGGDRHCRTAVFPLPGGVIEDGRNALVIRSENTRVTVVGVEVRIA